MKNGTTPKPVSMFFICGEKKTPCTALGCRNSASTTCAFPLVGKRTGQACDLPICAGCAQDAVCPAHKRMLIARTAL